MSSTVSLAKRIARRVGRGAVALHRDESGASMLFAAITFLALSYSIMFIYQVGMISSDRIQMQNAADASAYSGALVEANSLNAVAQINDGMAYLHYYALRYVVDCIVVRTLESFNAHHNLVRSMPARFMDNVDENISRSMADPLGLGPSPATWGDQFGPNKRNDPVPTWVLVKDGQELGNGGGDRWSRIQSFSQANTGLIDQTVQWLGDLQKAQRLIVAVTPRIVHQHVSQVALANGSEKFAMSRDLELAWRIGTGPNDGFEEMKGTGGELSQNMFLRYTQRQLDERDRNGQVVARAFPSWFDAARGRSKQSYSQIRLCWNKNDWGHAQRPSGHTDPAGPWNDAPNGHWHCTHAHKIQVGQQEVWVSHGGISNGMEIPVQGPFGGGGHFQDDTSLHPIATDAKTASQQDHASIICPTCGAEPPKGVGSQYTDIQKIQENASSQAGMTLDIGASFPRPLMPRPALLRSGVTVATWRASRGVGQVFPASPWGMVAVATGQIGLMDSNGKVQVLRALSQDGLFATYGTTQVPVGKQDDERAFFYSSDINRGMRFGARLVPVAGKIDGSLTPWNPGNAGQDQGIDALLGPNANRWVDANSPTSLPGKPPGAWGELGKVLRVKSEAELRSAIWH